MEFSLYPLLLLLGLAVSLVTWTRMARQDDRLIVIYVAALAGAFTGAKLAYLFAEGWLDWPQPDRWQRLLTGKSIVGALPGGYIAVELAKRLTGYHQATGNLFAFAAPAGIILGRIGCLLHGCCPGRVCTPAWYALHDATGTPRWPAVPMEIAFNALAILLFLPLRRLPRFHGQLFHLYLIGYGVFRFLHEYQRATPTMPPGLTGYQWIALACILLGSIRYYTRARKH